jgi:hypothetical protein
MLESKYQANRKAGTANVVKTIANPSITVVEAGDAIHRNTT